MFKGTHNTLCLTIGLWVVGWWPNMYDAAWTAEVMQHELQKCWNVSDVNSDPLFETNVFGRPCWLNRRLRTVIIERGSVFCIWKISGHLKWASTTIKRLRLLIRPANSTCIRDHVSSGRLGWKTCVADGLSVSVASSWVQRSSSSEKTGEKR